MYCLFVKYTVLLPSGVNTIAVNKYISYHIKCSSNLSLHLLRGLPLFLVPSTVTVPPWSERFYRLYKTYRVAIPTEPSRPKNDPVTLPVLWTPRQRQIWVKYHAQWQMNIVNNRRSILCSFCVEIMLVEIKQLRANYSASTGTERANTFVMLHCVLR